MMLGALLRGLIPLPGATIDQLVGLALEVHSLPFEVAAVEHEMEVVASVAKFEQVFGKNYDVNGIANFAGCA